MNPLETLKERLKHKPVVQSNKGFKVLIGQEEGQREQGQGQEEQLTNANKVIPFITAERDDGKRARDILAKIRQQNLSNIVNKPLSLKPVAVPVSHSVTMDETLPVPLPKPVPKPIKKPKIKKQRLVLEDDPDLEMDLEEPAVREPLVKELIEPTTTNKPTMTTKRPNKNPIVKGVIPLGPESMIKIGDTSLPKRLPPLPVFNMKVPGYYMNNREIFVNFVNSLFLPYKDEMLDESKGITCDNIGNDSVNVSLLTHQKIVRDYINLYTPYRGLLLYHGLGSGKTCSSIAIAEGMKSSKKIIIMTPASLRRNYIEEIKKCGDLIYRKNQFWEWISVKESIELIDPLSASLGLPREYIVRGQGAWLVNVTKPSNYNELTTYDKRTLNDQLDEMIKNKYTFINYNGLRRDKFQQLTNNFETNIFDNAVIIIDEAHNLISRIVNKINNISKFSARKRGPGSLLPQALSLLLYEFLLRAENCKIVLLTGTPIINYPNEIGILFNILRGYIKTWSFTLTNDADKKITTESLRQVLAKEKVVDYIDYIPSTKTLTITRNPFGFDNVTDKGAGYKGVKGTSNSSITDDDFVRRIVKILADNDIKVPANGGATFSVNVALPDTLDAFINNFINKENGNIINIDKFKRRIIGLTSYFRSAQEELLPSYDRNFDRHVVYRPMSDYQFKVYEDYRAEERKTEKSKTGSAAIDKDGTFGEPSSTYRIFSRLACNFVMPVPPGRPNPAQYRVQNAEKQSSDKMLIWFKDKHFKNREMDTEMLENYNAFILKIPPKTMEANGQLIQNVLDLYVNEYYNNHYRQPINVFAVQQGHEMLFEEQNEVRGEEEVVRGEVVREEEAQPKERDEPKDKPLTKQEAKAQPKVALPIGLTKAEQKEEKEREKQQLKEEKERLKMEAKEAKEREKAEAKEQKEQEKQRLKEEKEREKERLKAEKKAMKKGGGQDDEDTDGDEDTDEDNEDTETMRGGNPADNFIENIENNEEPIILNGYKDEDAILREADELEGDEILEKMGSVEYNEAIQQSLRYLQINSAKYLTPEGLQIYSPKFLAMLENIQDVNHVGLNLIYSQFRSMEGIGIFALTLEANGFAKFKIKKTSVDNWEIQMTEADMGKPCYALYTGTEDAEEREIIRNIYNGSWDNIPNNIAVQLRARSNNNNLGEIIKVLMITSAGSEGINLRNTRYVHIMEPYWHPVRSEQVIGRARRICSHQGLPKELQTVEVFVYIMTFTQQQLASEYSVELKLKDKSKRPPYLPQSSDEKLFEISTIKEQLTGQLLKGIKETSIDCATHIKSNTKEGLVCLSFGQPTVTDFSFNPNIAQDENDTVAVQNRVTIDWEARPFTIQSTGKKYMLRMDTKQVYDYESVIQSREVPGVRPILLGKLVKKSNGEYEIVKEFS